MKERIILNDPFYTDKSIVDWALNFFLTYRRWPKKKALQDDPTAPSPSQVSTRFGGIFGLRAAARLAGGLLRPDELQYINTKRQSLLCWLSQRARQTGRITLESLRNDPTAPSPREFAECCGGLDAALKMLGLPMARPSDEDLIEAIRDSAVWLDRTPRQVDAEEGLCVYTLTMYKSRFTRWNLLLEAAGLPLNYDCPGQRATNARRRAAKAAANTSLIIVTSSEALVG